MNVLIIGGLGYIGSALVELYRDRPEDSVTVLDRVFIPERIAGFPSNVRYIEGDMGDGYLMKRLVKDQDIVYLLAAEVEADKSAEKEAKVWEQNYELPIRVCEMVDKTSARLIFPSSANVFGGNTMAEDYIFTEEDTPSPKYPYAETKVAMEEYLEKRGGNFVTVRFGTNYGWAPGIRFNLVINSFAKRALQGAALTLHGSGLNYRPFCATMDCARASLFLATSEEQIAGEIFHVVSNNYQICEIAEAVREIINPEIPITHLAYDAPFSSYQMASPKLKRLGFQFKSNLKYEVDMLRVELQQLSHVPPLPGEGQYSI